MVSEGILPRVGAGRDPRPAEGDADRLYPRMPDVLRIPLYPARPWRGAMEACRPGRPGRPGRPYRSEIGDFETALRQRYGARAAVAVDSGRSALVLALAALGLGRGDEVLLAAFNCPAVVDAVLTVGATPVLVDLAEDFSLDLQALEAARCRRSRAVILTHAYGLPEDPAVAAWARAAGLAVIDDAAQAILQHSPADGARPLGSLGDAGVLSFAATKPLPGLGGGALLWFRPVAELEVALAGLGRESTAAWRRSWRSEVGRWRAQCLLSPALAPGASLWRRLGWLPRLRDDKVADFPSTAERIVPRRAHPRRRRHLAWRLAALEERRRAVADNFRRLARALADLPGARLLTRPGADACHHATLLLDHPGERFAWSRRLAAAGIQSCWNHVPLHFAERYRPFARSLERTEDLWRRVLSIPFHPPLESGELRRIVQCLQSR